MMIFLLKSIHKITLLIIISSLNFVVGAEKKQEGKIIRVVTSFSILESLVKEITQGIANYEIFNLVPRDLDPHTYHPRPQDSIVLSKANLVIINGLGFEGWLTRLIDNSGFNGKLIVASTNIKPRQLLLRNSETKVFDPHAWHDVQNVISYVKVITQSLQEFTPQYNLELQNNCNILTEKLKNLDKWIKKMLGDDLQSNTVLTTHDAFYYFGKRYGIQFIAPIGISTEAEPAAQDVANIIEMIKSHKISAIFLENLANPKILQQIALETQIPIECTKLYADTLPANSAVNTYIAMMKHNVQVLRKALIKKQ